jgi:hypothetical protein
MHAIYSQIDQKVKDLQQKVANGTLDLKIPNNFTVTAPPHDDSRRLTPQEIQSYSEYSSLNKLVTRKAQMN